MASLVRVQSAPGRQARLGRIRTSYFRARPAGHSAMCRPALPHRRYGRGFSVSERSRRLGCSNPFWHALGVEKEPLVITSRIENFTKNVTETQHEDRHRVRAQGYRWIALLKLEIGAFRDAGALGHHHGRQFALFTRERHIGPQLGERPLNRWRQRVFDGLSHYKFSYKRL